MCAVLRDRFQTDKVNVGALGNVEVRRYAGLTVDFVRDCGAKAVVRGVRSVTDFDYEFGSRSMETVITVALSAKGRLRASDFNVLNFEDERFKPFHHHLRPIKWRDRVDKAIEQLNNQIRKNK